MATSLQVSEEVGTATAIRGRFTGCGARRERLVAHLSLTRLARAQR